MIPESASFATQMPVTRKQPNLPSEKGYKSRETGTKAKFGDGALIS
jgi:hypothetical protein